MPERILDLRRGQGPIEQALVLSEYDLIVLEPSWLLRCQPGETLPIGHPFLGPLLGELTRRSSELVDFLDSRNTLVATLEAPCDAEIGYGRSFTSYDWWLGRLPLGNRTWASGLFIDIGAAETALVLTPEHPFANYLSLHRACQVRVLEEVSQLDPVTVLAENRRGAATAVEIKVGPGLVVLVPPPGSDEGRELLLIVGGLSPGSEPPVIRSGDCRLKRS